MKKITDYSQFQTILPYASEIFGVYQPLIGWNSKRTLDWVQKGKLSERRNLIAEIAKYYRGVSEIRFDANHRAELMRLELGQLAPPKFGAQYGSGFK